MSMTAVSGITPSGHLTVGNYLGALRRFAEPTDETGFYFVADLHAMTTRHDPRRLAALTRETALLLLASGLPEESVFIQSAVPAHAQLAYLLECTAYVGELSRMVQYKEKGRGKPMTRGSLFTYPCLMAADILLYGANRDPVGAVQQDVGGHEARVGEERVPGHRLAPSFLLVLHHACELADVRRALQQIGQLGVGGHGRLDEHRLVRQASCQQQQRCLAGQGSEPSRVVPRRHGMQVGHKVEPGLVGRFGEAAQCPEIVAQGQMARWCDAGDGGHGHAFR